MHCRKRHWPLDHRSHRWRPRLAVLRPVHGRSLVLVDAACLLRGTPVWLSGAAHLAILLRPVHGWSPVLVNVACLLHGTSVCLSSAAGGTFVHSTSATAITTLNAVVRGVGHTVSRRLPQLDGVRSTHAHDRLGARLWRHQPYHTPLRSHLVTQTSFTCPPVLHSCW
jgi:integral membrane sensor domain MASE1